MIIVSIFIGTFVGSGIEFFCIPLYGAFKSVFYFNIPLGIFCAISFAMGDYEQEGIESQIASGTIVGSIIGCLFAIISVFQAGVIAGITVQLCFIMGALLCTVTIIGSIKMAIKIGLLCKTAGLRFACWIIQ